MVTQVTISSTSGADEGSDEMNVDTRQIGQKSFASSEDYKQPGTVTGYDEYANRVEATSPDQLPDDTRVNIGGIEMLAKDARAHGLLEGVFEEAKARDEAKQERTQERVESYQEGEGAFYDAATAEATLTQAAEAGEISHGEARVAAHTMASMELLGLDMEGTEQVFDAYVNDPEAFEQFPHDVQETVERQIEQFNGQIAEAVVAELGDDAADTLNEMIAESEDIADAWNSYLFMRATGQANGLTFSDFLNDALDHLGWS